MEIKLSLHGILRDYLPKKAKGKATLTLPDGATVTDVIQELKIKQNVSVVVNGVEVEQNHILQSGEEVQLFRLIAGG